MCKEEVIWCCGGCTPEIRSMIDGNPMDEATQRVSRLDPVVVGLRRDLDDTISGMKEIMEAFHTFLASDGDKEKREKVKKPTEAETSTAEDHVEGPAQPWTVVKKPVKPFREILKEANEESRKEAEEEFVRKKNIIIHHLPELQTDERERRWEQDNINVKKFLETLELNLEIEKITRLGKRPEAKADIQTKNPPARPIKVTFKTEEDVKKIYNNLYKLKSKEPEMNNLRITPDRNEQEREKIRTLVETAKNLTLSEKGDHVHIVRGTRILRVRRRGQRNAAPADPKK